MQLIIKRTKKVKQVWRSSNSAAIPTTAPPAVSAQNNGNPAIGSTETGKEAGASMSGPASGEASEAERQKGGRFQAHVIVFGNNYLRPMSQSRCKLTGDIKAGLLHGDSFVTASGNVISSKKGRIEARMCKNTLANIANGLLMLDSNNRTVIRVVYW